MKLMLKPIAVVLGLALFSQTALALACASNCEMASKGNSLAIVQSKPDAEMGHHHHVHAATNIDSAKRELPSFADVAKCANHDVSPQNTNRLAPRDSLAIVLVVSFLENSADGASTFAAELPDIAATPPKRFTVLRI